jgi:hypothetical protein
MSRASAITRRFKNDPKMKFRAIIRHSTFAILPISPKPPSYSDPAPRLAPTRPGPFKSNFLAVALQREMDEAPHTGEFSHGQSTYGELKLSDVGRLFVRT